MAGTGADDVPAQAARLMLAGEVAAALDVLGPAFSHHPNRADLLALMAEAHALQGRLTAVLACRQAALAIDSSPDRRADLALALQACSRLSEAAAEAATAVAANGGNHYGAELVQGLVAIAEGRTGEAASIFRRLTLEQPQQAPAFAQLGTVLWAQGDGDGAEAALNASLTLAPGLDAAAAALGLIRLSRGRLAEGWSLYRRRQVIGRKAPPLQRLPARLEGRSVVVEGEQGLGDELFFLRFAERLTARGARVTYRPSAKLAPLVGRLPFLAAVAAAADGPAAGDLTVWAGDLPWLLDEPGPLPSIILSPDPDRITALRDRLAAFSCRPLVGVTWRAGTQLSGRLSKALSPEGLAATLAPLDCDVVILQRNPQAGEVDRFAAALGRPVLNLSTLNDDLASMLALLSLLDSQVAVSNTNIHLAAALGKPARLLLPHPPEFRWMDTGRQSPWFPGMVLYRQERGGSWRPALGTLAADLGGKAGVIDRLAEAVRLKDQGRWRETETACLALLAETPDDAGALHLLSIALLSDRRPAEAVAPLARLADLTPTADILRFLGQSLIAAERQPEAVEPLQRALALTPDHPGLAAMLASVLMESGRAAEALDQARACGATAVEGTALHLLGRSAEAVPKLRQALAANPGDDKALNSLAQAHYALGGYAEAEAAWGECLSRNPANHPARGSLALMLLGMGRLAEGWDHYRFRHTALGRPGIPTHRLPERLDGYDVLVIGEQGLGDELFFLRFVERLAARGPRLTYVPGPKIAGMVSRLPFLAAIADASRPLTADIGIWPGDLPWLLDETGPLPPVPLAADPDRIAAVRQRLAAFGPPPYVGVTWRAGMVGFNKLSKEISPEALAGALAGSPHSVVILQRAPAAGEIDRFARTLGRPVLDLSDANDDLESMLALLTLLDRQVAVSNTNIHLAASLGRSVDVLLPQPPEFRWLVSGDTSPWFRSCRLYRQGMDGGWRMALERLRSDLSRP
jgi:tetratricopeptide (TPR) repeat protein